VVIWLRPYNLKIRVEETRFSVRESEKKDGESFCGV